MIVVISVKKNFIHILYTYILFITRLILTRRNVLFLALLFVLKYKLCDFNGTFSTLFYVLRPKKQSYRVKVIKNQLSTDMLLNVSKHSDVVIVFL